MVRDSGSEAVALRQSRECGVGADREAGPRGFSKGRGWGIWIAIRDADGISRGERDGAVLPDGRQRQKRERSGGGEIGAKYCRVCREVEADAAANCRVCGRRAREKVFGNRFV